MTAVGRRGAAMTPREQRQERAVLRRTMDPDWCGGLGTEYWWRWFRVARNGYADVAGSFDPDLLASTDDVIASALLSAGGRL